MVFNTLTVASAVTPSVIETYFSHYLKRGPLRHKPTAHISYHEGLRLVREFLEYSSKHTVEDIQSFTGQWVPAPHWVRINDAEVAPQFVERAAQLLAAQLGERGLAAVGGKTWWQWRRPETPLRAEWIEMKKDYHERHRTGRKCERVILYIHGGAYYFGSVDEHRYQMQRHARKLRAQVLSPRYRLAPQFPFPCGLLDCLATYFYLLQHFRPSQILIAGDSAGGGMVLSVLVALRDQGQPLPAGTILLSPWVDLTHSFPSVDGDGDGDYIPPYGFHHRPSMAWPPAPSDGMNAIESGPPVPGNVVELPATAGLDMKQSPRRRSSEDNSSRKPQSQRIAPPTADASVPVFGASLRMELDGESIELKEQIQLYTTNNLLAHPLVSPVMQPSLGGLPPMLIQTGGAELLMDEQVYLAHKAAHPSEYPPNETIMREFDPQRKALEKWPPTDVQLQVWEDLCHVPHTLSFTRPAKYMYRSVAQFGAWALAHAQQQGIDIQNDDTISVISSGGDDDEDDDDSTSGAGSKPSRTRQSSKSTEAVGKAGDPLPAFKDHMIRQRVTRHGIIYPLAPVSEISALALDPALIGVPKPGPVRKWLATHQLSEQKFASERKKVDKKRAAELNSGYDVIPGENPPPTALVSRRRKGIAPEEKKRGRSWGLMMWSGWGSKHDETTLEKEQKSEEEAVRKASAGSALELGYGSGNLPVSSPLSQRRRSSSVNAMRSTWQSRWGSSRERERAKTPDTALRAPHEQKVVDRGQADDSNATALPAIASTTRPTSNSLSSPIPVEPDTTRGDAPVSNTNGAFIAPTTSITSPSSEKIAGTDHTYLSPSGSRPHNGVQAYPFKLRDAGAKAASTTTLDSQVPSLQDATGASTPHRELPGEAVAPVELPGAGDGHAMGKLPDARAGQPLPLQEEQRILSTEPTTSRGGDAVSPADSAMPEKPPFKLRNPVFGDRTSMLGSIGADGMPNAHYPFLGEEMPQGPGGGVDDTQKAPPFKIRSTVYEPDVTLGTPKATDYSQVVPEHGDWLQTRSGGAAVRESGVFGAQLSNQRIVGDQRDQSSSSLSTPAASASGTSGTARTAEAGDGSDDMPPPPPPKDENYSPARKAARGTAAVPATDGAPVIGDLSFEQSGQTKAFFTSTGDS